MAEPKIVRLHVVPDEVAATKALNLLIKIARGEENNPIVRSKMDRKAVAQTVISAYRILRPVPRWMLKVVCPSFKC